MDRENTEEIAGTPWTENELSAVADSYFRMLTSERASIPYSKAQNRRQLITIVHRSEGSIERKLRPAERDPRNHESGKAGEKSVVEFERDRLRHTGRDDLADEMRWVSELDGDGYDVRSFESDGQERLLEIKTTCGHERTAFWLTR